MPAGRIRTIFWHDPYVDYLIDERKRRNDEYYNIYGRSRLEFWELVARRFILILYTYLILKNIIFNLTNHLTELE